MRLSAVSYWADFFLAPLLGFVLVWVAPAPATWTGVGSWLGWVAGGLAAWTLFEYAVHRFIYHRLPYFRDIHEAHHAEPRGLIGAPPVLGLVLILVVFHVPLWPLGEVAASAFAIGALIGYVAYMVLHHAAHHWKTQPGTWLHLARRHHALHHHATEDCNFGITTSFWDRVFGTALRASRGAARSR